MIKNITLLLCFVFSIAFASAQNNEGDNGKRREQMERFAAEKKAFITKFVGLTQSDSLVFWPVYDELGNKKMTLHREVRSAFWDLRKKEKDNTVTAEDYKKVNDLNIRTEIKKAELEKEYYHKFEKILSPEKINKLYDAELKHNRELLKKVEDRGREKKE